METPVSFFNWSLRKLLQTEYDHFNKAGIKIIFCLLVFSLIKASIVIGVAFHYQQDLQLERAVVMLVIYTALLKLLLADKTYMRVVAHVMAWLGLLLIWSNVFLFAQSINILTLEFVFMLILGSFCLMNPRFGIIYSVAATLPVILHLIFGRGLHFEGISPNELASPGYEIMVVLNFITIVMCHYLFQQSFKSNIEEKEALNMQLQLTVKEAKLAAESKSEFLSTMTHELRTPLNSVIGISQLLLQDLHSREQEVSLQILKFSAENLYSLINNILDFNKLGSEKLDLEDIPVDLNELVRDTCLGLRFQAQQKEIDFVLDIDEEISGRRIITDPTRITQIIYNLAGNAIKFTEQGEVRVSLKVLFIDDQVLKVRFAVADTGIGISADKQEAIFESFTQASVSTARNFGGTGLGLAIVKRLLLLFDSSIQLESAPAAGSTFYFDVNFNLHQGPADSFTENPEADSDLSDLKILVVEDNHMNRLLLVKVFARWNNKPEFAVNGQEAIDKVSYNPYDVVLMDLHMPLVDGFEAARAIRAMADPVRSGVRIVALTASVSDNLSHKIKEAGMDDFLYKPFKLNDLYLKLKKVPV
jgi:signal transduction histidine kinase/ActR/RegA family two-component response regulator